MLFRETGKNTVKGIANPLMIFFIFLAICPAVLFLVGCSDVQKLIEPDPPIGVTFRSGFISNGVIQIHSTTGEKQLVCTIVVFNDVQNQQKKYSFALPPNESKEIGTLEMGWDFERGEYGRVEVEGYHKAVYFELENDGSHYRTWIQ